MHTLLLFGRLADDISFSNVNSAAELEAVDRSYMLHMILTVPPTLSQSIITAHDPTGAAAPLLTRSSQCHSILVITVPLRFTRVR